MQTIEQAAQGWSPEEEPRSFVAKADSDPDAQGEGVAIYDGEIHKPVRPDQPVKPESTPKTETELAQLRHDDYTRKTTALAREREQVASERQQVQATLAQLAATMQQMQQSGTAKEQQAAAAKMDRFLDKLDPQFVANLQPEAKQIFSSWDSYTEERIAQKMEQLEGRITNLLQERLAPVQQQTRMQALTAEHTKLIEDFGVEIDGYLTKHQAQIAPLVAQGASLTQALALTAPTAFAEIGRNQGQRLFQTTQTRKQAVNLEGGIPSPSADAMPTYTEGESMLDSFRAATARAAARS